MTNPNKRKLVFLATILALLFIAVWLQIPKPSSRTFRADGSAFVEYDASTASLSGSEATIMKMKRLHEAMEKYKQFNGTYPNSATDFISALYNDPQKYGFANLSILDGLVGSPDWRFSDAWVRTHDGKPVTEGHPEHFVPYIIGRTRPGGGGIGGSKAPEERDVLMYTEMYYHRNLTWNKSKPQSLSKPTGYYLVLWDDGEVAKVDKDFHLYVGNPGVVFKGQPGYDSVKPIGE